MFSLSCSISISKAVVVGSHFLVWISSAIVAGITAYFLNDFPHDTHLVFEMVISALVLGFWLPSFVVPFLDAYKFFYAPLNFIFSYLWLTAFIFAAQDYNISECEYTAPFGGKCAYKLTGESFMFIGLFFTIVAFLTEVMSWKLAATAATPAAQKEARQSVESTGV
ncbi:hypothetical protein P154DRAFT_522502 [Amniculicola lignicola CBS 123094]|uniref:MARVEL domain-containing protein n=1 Tax=Amniculicola lignicola CBS 123094 TaxID=1392246 RepID=A0A6A5WI55_9PLEO|nr:hypothetical protein P154DRAFT_522502 [Amniculicola lignicola CBS 123094]